MADIESGIESLYLKKKFKANDVSSIDNSWRTATIFSKEESLKNENKNLSQTSWFTKQWQLNIIPRNYLSQVGLESLVFEKICLKIIMKEKKVLTCSSTNFMTAHG